METKIRTADYWIQTLGMQAHPEGGFYKETYRSAEEIQAQALPGRFNASRSFSTAIYFLLRSEDRSVFHRIKSDELWHFYEGSSLTIYILDERGVTSLKLGRNPDKGESLQIVVPANRWFGALVDNRDSYNLSGCTVAPGFDYHDFELAERSALLRQFPDAASIINKLTT
ncbi:MAG: cupin domain-containing protein [Bacteroidota bacterium]